jgi:hypothetical protein
MLLLKQLFASIIWVTFCNFYTTQAETDNKSPTREYFTWSNASNTFVAVPVAIDPKSACLQPDFFDPNRPAKLPMNSASQCRQDVTVFEILGNKEKGFFVDLAAHEWQRISNSFSLEHHANWNGLCIEPIPDYAQGILENRRCKLIRNPVFSASNYHVTFKFSGYNSGIVGKNMDNKEIGNRDRAFSFLTVTLMNILTQFKAPFVIDYLSLDIEGAELHAMKHFDFGMYTFLLVTIERPTKELHILLSRHKYWFATILRKKNWETFGESLYIHESAPNFKKYMHQYRIVDAKEIDHKWQENNIGPPVEHAYLLEPPYVEA